MDGNLPSMVSPMLWPEFPINESRQQFQQQWHFDFLHQPLWGRDEDNQTFATPENSLLTYDSTANSGQFVIFFFFSNQCIFLISQKLLKRSIISRLVHHHQSANHLTLLPKIIILVLEHMKIDCFVIWYLYLLVILRMQESRDMSSNIIKRRGKQK